MARLILVVGNVATSYLHAMGTASVGEEMLNACIL